MSLTPPHQRIVSEFSTIPRFFLSSKISWDYPFKHAYSIPREYDCVFVSLLWTTCEFDCAFMEVIFSLTFRINGVQMWLLQLNILYSTRTYALLCVYNSFICNICGIFVIILIISNCNREAITAWAAWCTL